MVPDLLAAVGLVVFLLFDLITSASRSAFTNSSLAIQAWLD
jgi:hypothetical protein